MLIGPHPSPLPRGEGEDVGAGSESGMTSEGVWQDGCDWDALKQLRWCAGVASVGSVSADPNETQLEPSGVLVGSRFSSLCLLQTRVTKTPGMAFN